RAMKRLASSRPKPEAAPVMSTRRGPRGLGELPKSPAPDAAARPATPSAPAMAAVRAGERFPREGAEEEPGNWTRERGERAFISRTLAESIREHALPDELVRPDSRGHEEHRR